LIGASTGVLVAASQQQMLSASIRALKSQPTLAKQTISATSPEPASSQLARFATRASVTVLRRLLVRSLHQSQKLFSSQSSRATVLIGVLTGQRVVANQQPTNIVRSKVSTSQSTSRKQTTLASPSQPV